MSVSRASTFVKSGFAIATLAWCLSLVLPAAVVNDSMQLAGHRVFLIGIDALAAGMPGWLANPLALAAMVLGLCRRFAVATAISALACLVMLSSFYAGALARSNGLPIEQVEFKVGFFLWLAAFSLILATNAYAWFVTRNARTSLT